MNVERFWQLIESSLSQLDPEHAAGNMENQVEELRKVLTALPPEEIVEFHNRFHEQMNAAYHWDLWGAAYLIAGGCSDDGFTDFRGWLISQGRRAFERALSDPESLLAIAEAPGIEDVFFEEFAYVPAQVYEEKTGRELPAPVEKDSTAPAGAPWSEEGDDLQRRFPRLSARYPQE